MSGVDSASVEEKLLNKLPFEGENSDKKKCFSVSFEQMIGAEELVSGRWLQVSQSVYGFCVLHVISRGFDFNDIFSIMFYLYSFLVPCFVIGFVQGYLI